MDKLILIRYGEIALKGLNRSNFENKLVSNIKKSINNLGEFKVKKSQSRIFVEPISDVNINKVVDKVKDVFGIVSLSVVNRVESDIDSIKANVLEQAQKLLNKNNTTFKVECKRADKSFPINSQDLNKELGAHILKNTSDLKVDVHNPDFIIYVEVRDFTYVYSEKISGLGGMPVGTNGKATLLLSGGIDSPVAGYLVSKRGAAINAVHFHSHPYTSERAKEKVIDLTKILSRYCGKINLFIVPFTPIQMQIYEKCPHEQLTLIMRRFMMMIAERIASNEKASALITGESLGQVASQTIESLGVTDDAVNLPVFRPLVGLDKLEITDISQKIDTYETSILPYEDCCTVFVPKHPSTKPKLDKIQHSENNLDVEALIQEAVEKTELITVTE